MTALTKCRHEVEAVSYFDGKEWSHSCVVCAAKRGAEFLDEKKPGWAKEIHLDELDMAIEQKCILGQLYGDYLIGIGSLGVNIDTAQQVELGFTLGMDGWEKPLVVTALKRAWSKQVRSRR